MNAQYKSNIETFCAAVVSRLGLAVGEHNMEQVGQTLQRRIKATGCPSASDYLGRLKDPVFARSEIREVAAELGVGETYFFRHPEHFNALAEVALPQRIEARGPQRQLRMLSAGCASGEEAYSLAVTLMPFRHLLTGWDVRIVGVDANAKVLEKARGAHYTAWSQRGLSQARRDALFSPAGRNFALNSDIRSMVVFEERNLLDDAVAWPEEYFDIIFCRNVTIYFSPHATRQVVERLTKSLVPGGYLFLGPSETLRGISHEFHLRHSHDAFYYQKRLGNEPLEMHYTASPTAHLPLPDPVLPLGWPAGESWVTAISKAAGKIAALADRSRPPRPSATEPAAAMRPTPPVRSLDSVLELLKKERYADALAALDPGSQTASAAADGDTLLLWAVLLANSAQVAAAEEICVGLLENDNLSAPAHYLMAVCQEHRGDYLSAAEHDKAAIYLDAAFAFPRLHLGLLAKRLGDLGTARQELAAAAELLGREDASRILLLGGGFEREALVRFCQSNLQACGGQP